MGYLYVLTNLQNERRFVGKSNLDKKVLIDVLYRVLEDKKHYNDLLQKDWKRHNFDIEFIESDDCSVDCDKYIKDNKLLNPIYGYNVFNDLQNKKGRHKRSNVFSDDVCLLYCFYDDIQFWTRYWGLQRNVLSNRLGNFDLFKNGYYYRAIARYDDYYWTAARVLFKNELCLTASQLMDKMSHTYQVSRQLRITPRKISKFFLIHDISQQEYTEKGCIIFCPLRDQNELF